MRARVGIVCAAAVVVLLGGGCHIRYMRWERIRPPRNARVREVVLETTGYCHCGECCGWRRNWLGRPVFADGPNRGKAKQVGMTSSGVRARQGTIAADTALYPFGTVMYVPGYGYGRVEDRGGAIKGRRIDLYFPTHREAKAWGRVRKKVQVWAPGP